MRPVLLRSLLKAAIRPLIHPIWRRIWLRVQPIEARVGQVERECNDLRAKWHQHVPVLLATTTVLARYGVELTALNYLKELAQKQKNEHAQQQKELAQEQKKQWDRLDQQQKELAQEQKKLWDRLDQQQKELAQKKQW